MTRRRMAAFFLAASGTFHLVYAIVYAPSGFAPILGFGLVFLFIGSAALKGRRGTLITGGVLALVEVVVLPVAAVQGWMAMTPALLAAALGLATALLVLRLRR